MKATITTDDYGVVIKRTVYLVVRNGNEVWCGQGSNSRFMPIEYILTSTRIRVFGSYMLAVAALNQAYVRRESGVKILAFSQKFEQLDVE